MHGMCGVGTVRGSRGCTTRPPAGNAGTNEHGAHGKGECVNNSPLKGGACARDGRSWSRRPAWVERWQHDRLIDCSPHGNDYGRVHIGVGCKATRKTTEMCLIDPVAFVAVPTLGAATRAAGVAWIDKNHAHPGTA